MRGIECRATDHRFGGVVVQPLQALAKARLANIFGAVVPSGEKASFKVVDGKNPDQPGELAQLLAGMTFPAGYSVFLVNEGRYDVSSAELMTGGFEGPVQLDHVTMRLGPLSAGESVLLEELDYGMLDFVLYYNFKLTFADNAKADGSFSIGKSYALRSERKRFSQALGREAYLFELS